MSNMKNKKQIVIIALLTIAVIALVLVFAIGNNGKNETSISQLTDLSLTGVISSEDGQPCFISDKELNLKSNGIKVKNENIFFMDDKAVLEEAEKHVSMKASGIFKYNDCIYIEPQFFVSDDICIPTPYCLLHCSAQWADYLTIDKATDEQNYTLTFNCQLNGQQYEVFKVVFGSGEGEPIGKVMLEGETAVEVYLDTADVDAYSGLSENELNIIYSLQEELNYLYSKLGELDIFTSVI